MKYHHLLFAAVFLPVCLFSQSRFDYGTYLKGNAATQTFTDPSTPQDGTTQWDNLTTFGAGVYIQKGLTRRFGLTSRLLWQRKGFTEIADYGIIGSPIFVNDVNLQNRFEYLSLDLLLNYYLLKRKKFDVFCFAGGELSRLVKHKLESDIEPNNLFYPISGYRSGFNKWNGSWLAGLGCTLNRTIRIDLEVNRDFTPTIKKENLQVRNWLWSVGMGVSIPELFN